MSERSYTCLACPDRPVFHGKIAAHFHLRDAHRPLLDRHHPEELLSQGHEVAQVRVEHVGPYVCICDAADGDECAMKRMNATSMQLHLTDVHGIVKDNERYGHHFLSETDYEQRQADLIRERDLAAEDACNRFFLTMQSVRGVADFLTECRA